MAGRYGRQARPCVRRMRPLSDSGLGQRLPYGVTVGAFLIGRESGVCHWWRACGHFAVVGVMGLNLGRVGALPLAPQKKNRNAWKTAIWQRDYPFRPGLLLDYNGGMEHDMHDGTDWAALQLQALNPECVSRWARSSEERGTDGMMTRSMVVAAFALGIWANHATAHAADGDAKKPVAHHQSTAHTLNRQEHHRTSAHRSSRNAAAYGVRPYYTASPGVPVYHWPGYLYVPGRGIADEACNLPTSTCPNEYRPVGGGP
jgi:hypothetical protein